MTEYWSWLLAVFGILGIYFVGKKTVWGWLILLLNEAIWVVYAVMTEQYGFIAMGFVYAYVYIKSFITWRKEEI
jgi:hypothetical protein